ncbi:hypothetical protein OHT59_46860 [Streptomyces sp. NBC_00243]|uniref:hypothetical protein n=1 Tax=Streptomyces sp. NBC_00243 TaxID=2975688 RepID=UPI002DDAB1D8|nr:hypothetical protein [Streptomyces sp. NBC_00243]WRZ25513.1 hypothetical protein OHT59_46860 [Streptomyces sp. NBC_00243]
MGPGDGIRGHADNRQGGDGLVPASARRFGDRRGADAFDGSVSVYVLDHDTGNRIQSGYTSTGRTYVAKRNWPDDYLDPVA